MKKKLLLSFFTITLISCSSFAQTIKDNIDKAAKDKNTMDRAAKADVLIQKKIIADSVAIDGIKKVERVNKVCKVKYNKHKYKRKKKHSS
ncbi:MAG: hypothetical protein M3004_11670 [Bacteroidota bacterium]|nr:hypothetical protein [Bacteroidota bacterium]